MKYQISESICECESISHSLSEISVEMIMNLFEVPTENNMGDLALPCFALAKLLRKNPAVIANELAAELQEKKIEGIEKIETVKGYLNIFLKREMYIRRALEKSTSDNHGVKQIGEEKVVCMDYSSPNIAKNFHVGHLRTTIIGNSLYKIYDKLGYQVVRINHLGDWGTQFGKLIVAYLRWSSKEAVEQDGLEELLRIYVKFSKEAKESEYLMEEAREWFVKMEQEDEEALAVWNWFKEISMVEYKRIYDLLNISFDSYIGESYFRSLVPDLVKQLEEKQLLVESQGAKVVDLSAYDMPPCLILKNDGGSIYHSRDIAAALYRKNTYHFEKCFYVTGLEQTLHFKQVFKAIELMGYDWYDELVHVPYGLVSLEGAKLSTRNGNIVYAVDILEESMKRAMDAIIEKSPELDEKETVARQVGVGAVIFHDLFNQRTKNIDFVWDEVLSFDGTTGPYVQYTYARAKSILRKGHSDFAIKDVDFSKLEDDRSYELVKILDGYEAAVVEAMQRNEPSIVARYLIKLTTRFNKFYHDCPILQAEEECKKARLYMVNAVQAVIADACGLLGMECPEEM